VVAEGPHLWRIVALRSCNVFDLPTEVTSTRAGPVKIVATHWKGEPMGFLEALMKQATGGQSATGGGSAPKVLICLLQAPNLCGDNLPPRCQADVSRNRDLGGMSELP